MTKIGLKSSDKVTIPLKYILGVLSIGSKGGLISEGFSHLFKPPNHSPEHYPHKEKNGQESDLAPFF